jgi:hypothetical protein
VTLFKNFESVAIAPQVLEEILPSGCSKSRCSFSGLGYLKAEKGAPKFERLVAMIRTQMRKFNFWADAGTAGGLDYAGSCG